MAQPASAPRKLIGLRQISPRVSASTPQRKQRCAWATADKGCVGEARCQTHSYVKLKFIGEPHKPANLNKNKLKPPVYDYAMPNDTFEPDEVERVDLCDELICCEHLMKHRHCPRHEATTVDRPFPDMPFVREMATWQQAHKENFVKWTKKPPAKPKEPHWMQQAAIRAATTAAAASAPPSRKKQKTKATGS
jgi:hypothetical protein